MAQIDILPDKDGKSDTVAVAAGASATAVPSASPLTDAGDGSSGSGGDIPPATGSGSRLTGSGAAGGSGTMGGSGTTGGIGTGGAGLGGVPANGSGADTPSGAPNPSATQSGSSPVDEDEQPPFAATPKPTAPASTPVVPGVRIRSYASSRCIAVSGAQSSAGRDGSRLEIRDCDNGAWQKWDLRSDGTVRAFGLCMDVAGASTTNGTVIQLARCNGGWAQRFVLNKAHDLVNIQADKCVDVVDKQTANGTKLQLWSCQGTSNQKWYTS
ncbi:ricin-type beta-trefoil lectin domain protein [Streptomyces sp. NPDC001858]